MARSRGLDKWEMGGLGELRLLGRENLVRSYEAPLKEENAVSVHVFDCCHVFANMGEEGERGLLVSFENRRDCIV